MLEFFFFFWIWKNQISYKGTNSFSCLFVQGVSVLFEEHKTIACLEINCASTLDYDILRLIVHRETFVRWDEFLCGSTIPESHKLYCPIYTCSVLIINDTRNSLTKTKCLVCRRLFCAACCVPWHSEFSCNLQGVWVT
uniref:Putative IBR domain, E3 ubiquitin ligase RBR family n=1 Tax=Helianthus annuus TaxID=4232 RepID=A0A251SRC8_HELAN